MREHAGEKAWEVCSVLKGHGFSRSVKGGEESAFRP